MKWDGFKVFPIQFDICVGVVDVGIMGGSVEKAGDIGGMQSIDIFRGEYGT